MFEIPPIKSNPYSLAAAKFDSNIHHSETKISGKEDLAIDEVSFLI
jgi:hypothetical protein